MVCFVDIAYLILIYCFVEEIFRALRQCTALSSITHSHCTRSIWNLKKPNRYIPPPLDGVYVKWIPKFFTCVGLFFFLETLKTVKKLSIFQNIQKTTNFWKKWHPHFLPVAGFFCRKNLSVDFMKLVGQRGGSKILYPLPSSITYVYN